MIDQGTAKGHLSEQAVIPLETLDPAAPLDDLAWLDRAIGDARVVAIGESAHYNSEFYRLRHRILRYLVERHGFTAYAMESGFVEGWSTDGWVRAGGGPDELDRHLADGITSLMGLWTEMRDLLRWVREHNRRAARPIGFYGIDLPGSNASLVPGFDAVVAYLARADPAYEIDQGLRERVTAFAPASPFSAPQALAAYQGLDPEKRNALTAGLADLEARLTGLRLDYVERTGAETYERALHTLRLTISLDAMVREVVRGGPGGTMSSIRDAGIADTVEWILRREERVVVAAHNAHVQKCAMAMPGWPASTTMGMHLGERLADGYLVIGTTVGAGETLNTGAGFYTGELFTTMEPPRADSLDSVLDATHDGPFATDLRTLSSDDSEVVRAVSAQRLSTFYAELDPLDAFDIVVHLPHVTAAHPDSGALAQAPDEVRQVFAQWHPEK